MYLRSSRNANLSSNVTSGQPFDSEILSYVRVAAAIAVIVMVLVVVLIKRNASGA